MISMVVLCINCITMNLQSGFFIVSDLPLLKTIAPPHSYFHFSASPTSRVNGPTARLYNSSRCGSSGRQGVVQMRCNNTWNFINGSAWSYNDAVVVCRDLG